MELTKADHEAVSAAIREAERRTCGQIICVLSQSSSDYAFAPILWASLIAFLVPWPLIDLTQLSAQRIFVLQLVVFILAAIVLLRMPLRLMLVPRAVQRAQAHRAALEQFVVRRTMHTRNRCGILIFVSMAEHYARVIADVGIAQRVEGAEWKAVIDVLITHIHSGQIANGFVAAIERCAAIIAEHAPPDGSSNELPDRLYVM